MRFLRSLPASCAILCSFACSSRADVSYGSNARAFAMGGAGIAIVEVTQLLNNPVFANARADLVGAAVCSPPTNGIAERVSPAGSPTRLEAGARIKLMRAIYSHYIVNSANIINNTPAASAPELH